jgi:hypothetical protein
MLRPREPALVRKLKNSFIPKFCFFALLKT